MLTCPLCKKQLADPAPQCPRCQADLSVLADIMKDVRTLLDKAAAQARAGELGAAVAAYLEVLDVDPANAVARAALGDVLTAVRGVERARRWVTPERVLIVLLVVALTINSFVLGWLLRERRPDLVTPEVPKHQTFTPAP
jgi:hypothetical protein